jgi:hypothetical protein
MLIVSFKPPEVPVSNSAFITYTNKAHYLQLLQFRYYYSQLNLGHLNSLVSLRCNIDGIIVANPSIQMILHNPYVKACLHCTT